MKHFGSLTKILLTAAALAAVAGPVEARDLRGWNVHVPDYPVSLGMEKFGELVAERTNGRFVPSTFHSAELGNQQQAVEQMTFDGIDFAVFNGGQLGDVAPALKVVGLPYVFRSTEHMFNVVDGEVGKRLSDELAPANMVALAWYDAGARSFYTVEKPIKTPADVAGQKIRVPNAEIFVATAEALGANATPMAFAEVFPSLQTGVIDGAENNPPSVVSTRHHEVIKYYTLDEHLRVPEALVVTKTLWDSLSDEDKQIFREAAVESAELQRKLWHEREETALEAIKAAGVEIIEVADKQPFVDAMDSAYKQLITDPKIEVFLKDIQAVQ
ncbi:TRAP transporter substrate-binding protein [Rhizobiales bacterium]|uniref:TRAP transporter substrate-binding protein n=1 Tax=Hongsoonwoonella zoysiae TaxID=2821844 RepID=UPI00155FE654|nr:TRAP transporter substrate-binding protein [Hongsoonwoonella zoysiae]NRG19491.1 TRAP transporter substrate-binding protein [Hongsoonwoonella zoysiae]